MTRVSGLRPHLAAFGARGRVALLLGGLTLPAVGTAGGCGSGLKYTIDDAAIEPMPISDRAGVIEARKEQEIATRDQRAAATLLETIDRDLGAAQKERDEARLEIEKAVADQEGAKASRDPNQSNAAAHSKDVADLGMKVAEAKLEWLQQKKDWLQQYSLAADARVEAAKAHVELEKAKAAQQRGIKPSGAFQLSDYENQWKSRTSDWESEKRDAESEEKDAQKKKESWQEKQAQLEKMKG